MLTAPIRAPLGAGTTLVLNRRPFGRPILILLAMTDGHSFPPEAPATALPAWLEPLADLLPETIVLHVEVSGALVLIALLWLLLRPPWRGG